MYTTRVPLGGIDFSAIYYLLLWVVISVVSTLLAVGLYVVG